MKIKLFIILTLGLALDLNTALAQIQIINTYAGTTQGFSGDGAAATAAQFNFSSTANNIALDASGNLYVPDVVNNRIRMITPAGIVSTIAGIAGAGGYGGDGGPAVAARLNAPSGVAVDAANNVYIADAGNNRIRKITASTGIISTIAGTGVAGFLGDGAAAVAARLNGPWNLAFNSAQTILYFSDVNNQRVRFINLATGVINTLAGNGTAGFAGDGAAANAARINTPRGIAVDGAGNVYIADRNNNRIRKVTQSTGFISTFAGNGAGGFSGDGGPAAAASLNGPTGISIDATGNFYISDAANNRIRVVNSTNVINTVAANGTAGLLGDGGPVLAAEVNQPASVAIISPGQYFVSDRMNARIRYVEHTPFFAGGTHQSFAVCENTGATTINAIMAVTDADIQQTLTWTAGVGPTNGTIVASATASTTGGTVVPTGMTYSPNVGFSGLDTFTVSVTDGWTTVLDTIYVTVNPLPNPGPITSASSSVCVEGVIVFADTPVGGMWSSSNVAVATVDASGNVTGVSQGTATITYSLTNGCGTTAATAFVEVLMPAKPINGNTTVCIGTTIALTDSTLLGTWSATNGNATVDLTGTVTGVTSGIDTIIYTVTNVCGTSTATVAITVIPLITISPITGLTTVCEGASITLSDATTGGIWATSNPNATASATGVITGLVAGFDTVLYYVFDVCGLTHVSYPIFINPIVSPSVSISMNPTVPCTGLPVTFNAIPVNGGSLPAYQWTVNGVVAGSGDSLTYIPSSHDTVKVIITANNPCVANDTSSNYIVVPTLVATVTPTIGISTGIFGDTVCVSQSVVFSAIYTHGGGTPVFQWRVNGSPLGTGATFTWVPINHDNISVTLVSNQLCAVPDTVTSNVVMTVDSTQTPTVYLTISPSDTVCDHTLVILTAHGAYGGTAPQYLWTKNGVPVATGKTFSYYPSNLDTIRCRFTSNSPCAVVGSVTSLDKIIHVIPLEYPALTVSETGGGMVAYGHNDTFTAVGSGLPGLTYQWSVNGFVDLGATSTTFVANITGPTTVSCGVTGISTGTCPAGETIKSIHVTTIPSGIKQVVNVLDELSLTPNPNTGKFIVSGYSENDRKIFFSITNVLGEEVYSESLIVSDNKVDQQISLATGLSNGIYFLHITTESESKVIRFILSK